MTAHQAIGYVFDLQFYRERINEDPAHPMGEVINHQLLRSKCTLTLSCAPTAGALST
jgi:hypothetical protein